VLKVLRKLRLLPAYFENIHVDAVYCSPLQRAQKTASIIAARKKLPLHVDENLKEVHFGIWEGHNHEEIDAMSHDEWARFFTDPKGLNIPEGESYVHVQKRMAGVWEKICKEQGLIKIFSLFLTVALSEP
jgi:broad specificity phosphatase PhoE